MSARDLAVPGLDCQACGRKNKGQTGIKDWKCKRCGEINEASGTRKVSATVTSERKVGVWQPTEQQGACRNHPMPDLWFADEAVRGEDTTEEAYKKVFVAMRICNECPIQQACLKYALTDGDAIRYGIWGGTFGFERLGRKNFAGNNNPFVYQFRLRKRLEREGLTCPPIPLDLKKNTLEASMKKRQEMVWKLTLEGMKPKEIASRMGITASRVYADLKDGRKLGRLS